MKQIIRIGMDNSKHIFQLHGVDTDETPVLRKKFRRREMAALLSQTLEEEKQTDLKLTEVTMKAIMPEALAGDDEEGSKSGSRRKAA